MMKRLVPYLLSIVCLSVCLGGLHDADDGYLTAGEYGVDVWLEGSGQLFVIGGGADKIEARNNSYVEVRYTSTPLTNNSGIYDIFLHNNSRLLYLNGITEEITTGGNATALLKGGRIDYITSFQNINWLNWEPVDQHIEMEVREVTTLTDTLLEGVWNVDYNNDGLWDTFHIQLINMPGYDLVRNNIKFTIIPEPAMLALLSLGGLYLKRERW